MATDAHHYGRRRTGKCKREVIEQLSLHEAVEIGLVNDRRDLVAG